jgi:thiol-disulfide isomerase/thioredoxin
MSKSLFFSIFLSFIIFFACAPSDKAIFEPSGAYRATLLVQGETLGFNFELSHQNGKWAMVLINGEERIEIPQVSIVGDSLRADMHIFDCVIKAVWKDGRWDGIWKKNYLDDYEVVFNAIQGDENRFAPAVLPPSIDMNGKWSVTFFEPDDTIVSVGIFEQTGALLTGTFLTPLGDYRYLQGQVNGQELVLSAFDGEHAFLFKGEVDEAGHIQGDFWSGKHFYASWIAHPDEEASLPDANSLTFLKEGYDKLEFSFPNLNGEMVGLQDEQFQGKVVVLQLFGTWCPNCMDETRFLSKWHQKNNSDQIEIIGLAYEKKNDFEYAKSRIEKVIERFDVGYQFLVAGTSDKDEAAKTLPALNKVLAFPTTIFVDKNGEVRKIHTGFSGPGTGKYYEMFVEEFNATVKQLMAE